MTIKKTPTFVMYTSRWRTLFKLLCLLLSLSICDAQGRGGNACEDGWRFYNADPNIDRCFRAVSTPMTWQRAQEYCKRNVAHLVNVDPIARFFPFSEVDQFPLDYIFAETGGDFWSGMHVQDGRLMWDAYGPEYVMYSTQTSWQWAQSQPTLQEAAKCGHVTQGRRIIAPTEGPPIEESGSGEIPSTQEPPTTTVRAEFNGTILMSLALCDIELPFVCQKPTTRPEVRQVSVCPENWFGNLYLPYCLGIVKDPLPHEEAKKACQEKYGGEMLQTTPNSFNEIFSINLLRYYLVEDTLFQNSSELTAWVDRGPVPEAPDRCYAVKEVIDVGHVVRSEICANPHPYICAIPTVKSDTLTYEVISPFFSQKELRANDPFTQLPITATFSRPPNENEIIFIKTPTRYINSSQGYTQTIHRFNDKLNFEYNLTFPVNTVNQPYEVQVWLPIYRQQLLARKKRGTRSLFTEIAEGGKYEHMKGDHFGRALADVSGVNGHDNKELMIKLLTDFMSKKHKRNHFHKKRKHHHSKKNHHSRYLHEDEKEFGHHHRNSKHKKSLKRMLHDGESIAKFERRKNNHNNHKRMKDGLTKRKSSMGNIYELDGRRVINTKRRQSNGHNSVHHYRRQIGHLSHRSKRGLTPPNIPDIPDFTDQFGDDLLVDFNRLYLTTGYYSFGVYTINPPSYVESSPMLVRFAEPDWFVYVITIDLAPGDDFFTPESNKLFNLYDNEDYVGMLNEVAAAAMTRTPTVEVKGVNGESIPNVIRFYRAIPESVSGSTFKLRAYVNVFTSRNFNAELEQTLAIILEDHWKDRLPSGTFVMTSLQVRSTVACPTDKVTIDGVIISFPSTSSGETAFSWDRCIGGGGAYATRECFGGYDSGVTWGNVVLAEGCEPFPELPESPSTVDLKRLSEVVLNTTNFNQVLNDTIRLTAPDVNLTEADIIYTAEILYNFWNFEVAQPNILDDIYEIANNVLERIPAIIDAAQTITNAANRIIESVEEITTNADLLGMKSLRVIKTFLATNIWDQDGTETPVIGLKFHDDIDDEDDDDDVLDDMDLINVETPSDTDVNVTDTAIYLDPELFQGRRTRAVYQIYSRTTLFNKVNSNRFELISKVAAARLEVDNILITDLGNNSVVIIFKTTKYDENTVCAFWDYRADEGAGGWATEGCNKTVMEDDRIMCVCNHLTNFAVLIDLQAYKISDTDKLILEIVTKVGLIISIIGLGLTILTFILFKHLRNGRGQQVLINLAVSMICSAIIFLVGMDRTEHVVGCKVVAALLHYFILVSFMWMLVEGILQYLRFVKVLGTYIPNFMLKTMIPAWGIPIIPVVVVAAIDHDLYFGGNGYCWLERDAMLYGFIIPVAVILFANLVVFCLVMINLLRRRSNSMKSNQSERKMAYLHFQAAVSIFVILGLTWVFGFLAIDGARVIFHYIFAILNAFQGFFIFLLFTLREKMIRKAWKKMCCKEKAGKFGSSSTGSDVPRRVTKSSDTSNSTNMLKDSNGHTNNGNNKRHTEFSNIGYEPN